MRNQVQGAILLFTVLSAFPPVASSQAGFDVALEGFQEVPPISTTGTGRFSMQDAAPFQYQLEYQLEGEIVQAHIHLGQGGVNGGVMIWLCANPNVFDMSALPPGTPACMGSSDVVIGEIVAEDVVGPPGQGIPPGEGAEALAAIRSGVAYVNVHSNVFPSGEIRGQIRSDSGVPDDLEVLREEFEGHTHTYRTGPGQGHNNTEATSGLPDRE